MATWVERGNRRVVVDGNGKVTHYMKIVTPSSITFPIADEGATPVLVRAYLSNVAGDEYITVAQCETAMELIIG